MSAKIKSIFLAIVLVILMVNGCGGRDDRSSPATIAVLAHSDFVPDRTEISARSRIGLPEVLSDRIIEHLTNSKRFVPVDRKALRRTVLEQRFGQKISKTYLDQTLDKAIAAMKQVEGGNVTGVAGGALTPEPVGKGISRGSGAVGTTGALADYNDILRDFKDLGSTVGADYLVLGNLEKLSGHQQRTSVPYSREGRIQAKNIVDARMNLRIVDSQKGTVIGAASLQTQIADTVFNGMGNAGDEFTVYDQLARLAAIKVLDMIYPARIVSTEPLVISRGSNDGVRVDDVYLIEREGKAVSDGSGQEIARLKDPVGRAQVVSVQDTIAVVKPLEHAALQKDDLATLDIDSLAPLSGVPEQAQTALGGSRAQTGQRPRLAVTLIKLYSTETPKNLDIEQHTPLFTDTLISRLTQTRRFEMLDRQEVDQLLNEQTLIALRDGHELGSAVGALKGADYLMYGSLAVFNIEKKKVRLPGSAKTFTRTEAYMEGNMRIVDARSGQVMESRKISLRQSPEKEMPVNRLIVALADAYAEQAVLLLMNKLYPLRVAAVGDDGTVYINRGEDGGLYQGEVLEAYRLGEVVIDPQTGFELGREETALGQVKIQEVEDARGKGYALNNIGVMPGDLLKRSLQNRTANGEHVSERDGQPSRSGAELVDRGNPSQSLKPSGEKYTLVVGRLRVNPEARSQSLLTDDRVRKMANDFVFKLTHSNRFNVLERHEVDQILNEKQFDTIVSGGAVDDRIGEMIGADYLIHGDIDRFSIDLKTEPVPYLNEQQISAKAVAEGVFRIVDVHSGEVKAGDRFRVSFDANNIASREEVESRLQDEFSTQAVARILQRLFPVKVLGVADDGVVYLNRGEDAGLKSGEIYDVMRPGQELIDPDTGRSFGSAETKVASLQLVAIEPSRSRGSLVKSGGSVRVGDILRKAPPSLEPEKPAVFTPNW